jgi:hypothetical protein
MRSLLLIILVLSSTCAFTQKKTLAQIKTGLQQAQNPIAYVRDSLKKRYKLDTIIIARLRNYNGIADSLAYHGQIRKVYGPYEKGKAGSLQIHLPTASFNALRAAPPPLKKWRKLIQWAAKELPKAILAGWRRECSFRRLIKQLVNTKKARCSKCGRKPVFTSLKKQRTQSRITGLR